MSMQRVWVRLLRFAFPKAFRERFGRDFETFVASQRREPRYAGILGTIRFWTDVTADVVRSALSVRVSSGRHRIAHPSGRLARWFDEALQDVRFGIRTLVRSPSYTVVSTVTLALGIGANSAMFTVVNSVLLRPLPFPDSDRLVMTYHATGSEDRSDMSYLDFQDYVDQNRVMSALGGWTESGGTFTGGSEPQQLNGIRVSAAVMPLLGVRPDIGRFIAPDEDIAGAPRVVVLSHRLWLSRFGGDSTVIGTITTIDGRPHEIIGVMPAGFAFPTATPDFWIPLRRDELLREAGIENPDRRLSFITGIGRLAPDATIDLARRSLSELALRVQATENPDGKIIGINLVPLQEWLVGASRGTLLTLFGAVACVLAIACVNVASLTIGRTTGRLRELSLRRALGAGRFRVARQLLTENVILAAFAGSLGILMALGLTNWLVHGPELVLPRQADVALDGTVVLFATTLSIVAGIGLGAFATIHLLADGHSQSSRDTDARAGIRKGTRRVHHVLVVSQIALALTLLVGAGLLIDSFRRLTNVDPGFPTDDLLTLRIGIDENRYDSDERVRSFYESIVESIRVLPGIEAVATTYSPAFLENDFEQTIEIEGRSQDDETRHWVGTVIVGDSYFQTSRVPILAGRGFTNSDGSGSPLVAVVNQTMVSRFWPDVDPVGKRFRINGGISGSVGSLDRRFYSRDWITIVGVSGDERRSGLANAPVAEFYRPHAQMRWPGMSLLIRTSGDPLKSVPAIERAVWTVDPNTPIPDVRTMNAIMSSQVATPRWRTTLLTTFAALAVVLATVGIYGVITYGVLQRVREIGIRMALGAPGQRVRREVLGSGIRLALIGVALGVGGAAAVAHLLESLLFEVMPFEVGIYIIAAGAMIGIAGLACYIPARRASTIDPLVALRDS